MQFLSRGSLVALFGVALALSATAQTGSPPEPATPVAATAARTLTGKERLGRKWMDEQRIDNCNVPIAKRGTKPRPSVCPNLPTS
jgi:hypothetical protein